MIDSSPVFFFEGIFVQQLFVSGGAVRDYPERSLG
jgi:hypothetical protein